MESTPSIVAQAFEGNQKLIVLLENVSATIQQIRQRLEGAAIAALSSLPTIFGKEGEEGFIPATIDTPTKLTQENASDDFVQHTAQLMNALNPNKWTQPITLNNAFTFVYSTSLRLSEDDRDQRTQLLQSATMIQLAANLEKSLPTQVHASLVEKYSNSVTMPVDGLIGNDSRSGTEAPISEAEKGALAASRLRDDLQLLIERKHIEIIGKSIAKVLAALRRPKSKP